MRFGKLVRRGWLPCLLAGTVCLSALAVAQPPSGPGKSEANGTPGDGSSSAPAYKVAERSVPIPNSSKLVPAQTNEHPLVPAIRWARQGMEEIEKNIQDYSTTVAKRERIDGKLGEYEYMFIKVRQKPFSVYLYFMDPPSLKGQEVIYIEGQNNGKMWAHPAGFRNKIVGTLSLDPTGLIAMRGQRYPITELGLGNLVKRLAEIAERDAQYGECEVKFFQGAKINDRTCTCIQVTHPVPRRNFLFHVARIFVDDELNLPIRYESHDWPTEPGGQPQLIEEYTYLNLKINNGFTDADFDVHNPNYQFNVD